MIIGTIRLFLFIGGPFGGCPYQQSPSTKGGSILGPLFLLKSR